MIALLIVLGSICAYGYIGARVGATFIKRYDDTPPTGGHATPPTRWTGG